VQRWLAKKEVIESRAAWVEIGRKGNLSKDRSLTGYKRVVEKGSVAKKEKAAERKVCRGAFESKKGRTDEAVGLWNGRRGPTY